MSTGLTLHELAAKLRSLIDDVREAHRTPGDTFHNGCDRDLCAWCEEAGEAIDALDAVVKAMAEERKS